MSGMHNTPHIEQKYTILPIKCLQNHSGMGMIKKNLKSVLPFPRRGRRHNKKWNLGTICRTFNKILCHLMLDYCTWHRAIMYCRYMTKRFGPIFPGRVCIFQQCSYIIHESAVHPLYKLTLRWTVRCGWQTQYSYVFQILSHYHELSCAITMQSFSSRAELGSSHCMMFLQDTCTQSGLLLSLASTHGCGVTLKSTNWCMSQNVYCSNVLPISVCKVFVGEFLSSLLSYCMLSWLCLYKSFATHSF